jgi:hypothetical protein
MFLLFAGRIDLRGIYRVRHGRLASIPVHAVRLDGQ